MSAIFALYSLFSTIKYLKNVGLFIPREKDPKITQFVFIYGQIR